MSFISVVPDSQRPALF
ncbi:hypothetical protein LINPERHAP1_LOCUS11840 [Linum perenne]